MRDSERDYIGRTIATIRNHRDAENCWPQWANALADEIERLDAALEQAERDVVAAREAAHHLTEALNHDSARLAKVPALVEALREWDERTAAAFDALHLWDLHDRTAALLTVYEQSQGNG